MYLAQFPTLPSAKICYMGILHISRSVLIFLLIFQGIVVFARQFPRHKIDSLRSVLESVDGQKRANVLNQLSWEYRNLNSDSCLYFANAANQHSHQISYTDGIIQSLNYLGIAYRNKSEYSKAFEYFMEALKSAENVENLEQIGYSNINIGNIYIYQTNYEGAINYFERALESAISLDDKNMMAYCFLNLGRTYARMEDFIKAEDYYLKTRNIRHELGDLQGLITSAVDLAQLFMLEGDRDKALKYFFISLEDIKKVNNQGALAFSLNHISIIYRDKGEYDLATKYAKESMSVAIMHGLKNDERKAMENLSLINELQGNYKEALSYFKGHIDKRDSIFNEENTRTIESLKSQYEAEKLEAKNEFEKAIQASRQKFINTVFVVSFALLAIIAIVLFRSAQLRKRLNRKIQSQKDQVERDKILIERQSKKLEELDFAKSRFFSNISHDLRSPLSIILGNHEQIHKDQDNYLSKKSKKYLDVANKNAKRLLYLTDEINELTKLEEGKLKLEPVLVKLHPYMNLLVNMFSSTAEYKSIDLKLTNKTDEDLTLKKLIRRNSRK